MKTVTARVAGTHVHAIFMGSNIKRKAMDPETPISNKSTCIPKVSKESLRLKSTRDK